jgi:hypothetical protein
MDRGKIINMNITETLDGGNLSPESQERLKKFIRKQKNNSYNPIVSKKNMEKLRELADYEIVSLLLKSLDAFDIRSLDKLNAYEGSQVIGFWAYLAASNDERALTYLDVTADMLKGARPYLIRSLYNCCRYFPNVEKLNAIAEKLKSYYDPSALQSYIWAKNIGLNLSDRISYWGVKFVLSTTGEYFKYSGGLTQEADPRFFQINVSIFAASIHGSYNIILANDGLTVRALFHDKYIIENEDQEVGFCEIKNGWKNRVRLPINGDLLHLKELIAATEKRYNVSFVRKLFQFEASKGIDERIIQRWIDSDV